MNENYPIILDGKKIGVAQVGQESLYFRIRCKCLFPDSRPWRVKVRCNKDEIDLGVCVSTASGRGLETRIPVKLLDREQISFHACLEERNTLYAVYENEPFDQASQLLSMRFVVQSGQRGLVFR